VYCYLRTSVDRAARGPALSIGSSRFFEVMGAMELRRSEALRFPTPAAIAGRRHPPNHVAIASSHIVQFYENDQFLCAIFFFFIRRPPRSTLFPYTTRSS